MACVAGGISGHCCSFKKVPWAEQFSQLHIAQCKGLPIAQSGTFCLRGSCPARSDGEEFSRRLGKISLVESEILGFGLSPSRRFKGAMARESAAGNCFIDQPRFRARPPSCLFTDELKKVVTFTAIRRRNN